MRQLNQCRSWLFLPGADPRALAGGPGSGADVLIQELEDSVPPSRRNDARGLVRGVVEGWRAQGSVPAVRVNPLACGGVEDLQAVVPAAPAVIMLPKTKSAADVAELDRCVGELERAAGLPDGRIALVPNVECAAGLLHTHEIASATSRVVACLVASEDMAASLEAVREPDGAELAYVRARFHVECAAAGILSIDCPYTFSDIEGLRAETAHARRLGYRAKSAVAPLHVPVINELMTPSDDDVARAAGIVDAFERAASGSAAHAQREGRSIEMPTYLNARRTLARAEALKA